MSVGVDEVLASELVGFFGGEHEPGSGGRRAADAARAGRADARATLRALLTVRPPAPMPAEVEQRLDQLLDAEAAARGVVEADTLPVLASTHQVGGVLGEHVALWRGDLTVLRVDAIVNAANTQLLGCFVPEHRCIDNVIHAAAGPRLRDECAAYMAGRGSLEPTGGAVLTSAHHLPAGHVVHTVGPIVRTPQPTARDAQLLASCYRSVLDVAAGHGLASVGFCSISTGVFGYPKPAAARVALDIVERWLLDHPDHPVRVVISAFADVDDDAYTAALHERTSR